MTTEKTKREAASVAQLRRYQARLSRPWILTRADLCKRDEVPVPRVFRGRRVR